MATTGEDDSLHETIDNIHPEDLGIQKVKPKRTTEITDDDDDDVPAKKQHKRYSLVNEDHEKRKEDIKEQAKSTKLKLKGMVTKGKGKKTMFKEAKEKDTKQNLSTEELLDVRCKQKRDKFCW